MAWGAVCVLEVAVRVSHGCDQIFLSAMGSKGVEMKNNRITFECECHSYDHAIFTDHYVEDEPDGWNYFTIGTQLAPLNNFFKRVRVAVKYIFNPHDNVYSHWHETELDEESVVRLMGECNRYLLELAERKTREV